MAAASTRLAAADRGIAAGEQAAQQAIAQARLSGDPGPLAAMLVELESAPAEFGAGFAEIVARAAMLAPT